MLWFFSAISLFSPIDYYNLLSNSIFYSYFHFCLFSSFQFNSLSVIWTCGDFDMELVQDLVWTASVALILSFFVAKLVAIAMADREPDSSEFKVMEEVRFKESLRVGEVYQSQRRVEFAGEVKEVDRFEGKLVRPVEEVVGPVQDSQGESSAGVEIAKRSDDGEKVSVEKASDSDRQRGHEDQEISEMRLVSSTSPESAANDVVAAHCDEAKGKSEEAVEVKSGSYSDEDDWEGIEKSELDEDYIAAVKSERG